MRARGTAALVHGRMCDHTCDNGPHHARSALACINARQDAHMGACGAATLMPGSACGVDCAHRGGTLPYLFSRAPRSAPPPTPLSPFLPPPPMSMREESGSRLRRLPGAQGGGPIGHWLRGRGSRGRAGGPRVGAGRQPLGSRRPGKRRGGRGGGEAGRASPLLCVGPPAGGRWESHAAALVVHCWGQTAPRRPPGQEEERGSHAGSGPAPGWPIGAAPLRPQGRAGELPEREREREPEREREGERARERGGEREKEKEKERQRGRERQRERERKVEREEEKEERKKRKEERKKGKRRKEEGRWSALRHPTGQLGGRARSPAVKLGSVNPVSVKTKGKMAEEGAGPELAQLAQLAHLEPKLARALQ